MELKRIVAIMMAALLILLGIAPSAFAAAVPKKQGYVLDKAGMFEKSSLEQLEQSAQEGELKYYILTINSLDGEDSAVYATKVYKAWELETNDVLLVIANNEKRIEMNFNNPALQGAIDQLPVDYDGNGDSSESRITEFINVHFIPQAKAGDFAQASLELMQAVNNLDLQQSTPTTAPNSGATGSGAGSGAAAGSGSQQPGSATKPAPQQQTAAVNTTTLLAVIAGIIVIGFLILAAIAWQKKRKLEQQHARIAELMVEVERANGELKPYVGLVMGATEQLVANVDQGLSQLLVSLDQLRSKTEAEKIFALHYSRLNKEYASLKAELDKLETALEGLRGEITRMMDADKNVRKTTDELHQRLDLLRTETDDRKNRLAFPFTHLYKELDRLDLKLAEADRLEVFDPIEGDKQASEAWHDSGVLESHVNAIDAYLAKYRSFPTVAGEHRAEIEQITEENHIRKAIMRLNPYASIDKAQVMMEELSDKLQEGVMHEVISLGEHIDGLLRDAVATAKRQAELKQQNSKDIEFIEAKQGSYRTDIAVIEGQFPYVRTTYSEHHWTELQQRFDQMKTDVREAAKQLPELKRLNSDDHQEYEHARELIDGWLSRYLAADTTVSDCTRMFRELEERYGKAKQQVNSLWNQFDSIQALIRRERLPENAGWQQSFSVINEAYRKLFGYLAAAPYHMDHIEAELRQFESDVNALQSQVNRKVEEKREAERRMREAQAMYETAYRRAGSKINRNAYNSTFGSLSKQAEQMIAAGMYAQAISEMSGLNQIVDQMNREHQAAEAAERMEEMHRHNQSSGGSGFGSGGGHSSGGGSWGSGGSSGGGSNSNGNSSGGSNW